MEKDKVRSQVSLRSLLAFAKTLCHPNSQAKKTYRQGQEAGRRDPRTPHKSRGPCRSPEQRHQIWNCENSTATPRVHISLFSCGRFASSYDTCHSRLGHMHGGTQGYATGSTIIKHPAQERPGNVSTNPQGRLSNELRCASFKFAISIYRGQIRL